MSLQRGYNLAMGKPFQFAMRQMFPAMVLFCFAAWLLSIAFRPFGNDGSSVDRMVEFVGTIAFAIAGVGAITGESLWRIVRALIFLVLGTTAVIFLVVVLHII
jgi:hypothetical protein